ncbi:MAG: 2OG-Fe(II) oxygenase [Rhodomicrobium sp.]
MDFSRHPVPSFANRITAVSDFLGAEQFANLQREVEALSGEERSYVPAHKKGATIAHETLIEHAPAVTAFYHSEAMTAYISRITGVAVRPTPLQDQNSLSILIYERPGDHIGWHYDHNFYRGHRFTVLLPLVNRGKAADGLSHARLRAKIGDAEAELRTPPNTLIIFEGARVMHKATPLAAGERRVLISMTYCADAHANIAQAVARRLKDTAYFGVRALWT